MTTTFRLLKAKPAAGLWQATQRVSNRGAVLAAPTKSGTEITSLAACQIMSAKRKPLLGELVVVPRHKLDAGQVTIRLDEESENWVKQQQARTKQGRAVIVRAMFLAGRASTAALLETGVLR